MGDAQFDTALQCNCSNNFIGLHESTVHVVAGREGHQL